MVGGVSLFMDVKDPKAKAFYDHFGLVTPPSNYLELFLPLATIQ